MIYDTILSGGYVIDPCNSVDSYRDVAIKDGRIAAVERNLDKSLARSVQDVTGSIVAPGLIDLHTHVYHKGSALSIDPRGLASRSSATTLVDAGSSGAGNFAGFRDHVIARESTRILAFLNISFPGIFAIANGLVVGEAKDLALLSVEKCGEVAAANPDIVVGIKIRLGKSACGDNGIQALDLALEVGNKFGIPVMAHIGDLPPSAVEILGRLRPGDIATHCFQGGANSLVTEAGDILPEAWKARERGVLFDVGHGFGAFSYAVAETAIARGFKPDTISSDAHVLSYQGPAFDLLHTMGQLRLCGLQLPEIIAMVTKAPASAIGRRDLGHITVGGVAEISILRDVDADTSALDSLGVERCVRRELISMGTYAKGEFRPPEPRLAAKATFPT